MGDFGSLGCSGLRVLGFRVLGLGFGVWGLGGFRSFGVWVWG